VMDKHWGYVIILAAFVVFGLWVNSYAANLDVKYSPDKATPDNDGFCAFWCVFRDIGWLDCPGCDCNPPPPSPDDTCQSFCDQLEECFWDSQCLGTDHYCSLCSSAKHWCSGSDPNCYEEHRAGCEIRCGTGVPPCTEGVDDPDCDRPDAGGGDGDDEDLT
jgi:hypothetical protein